MTQEQRGLTPWQNLMAPLRFNRMAPFFPALWEDMFGEMSEMGQQASEGLTVYEDKKNVYVEAAMPGLKPADIEISIEKGVLWIRGEKKEEEENKEKRFYRRAVSSFSYRFALPRQIDEAKEPEAVYQDGMMRITFTKAQESQTKKIAIKEKKK